MFANIKKTTVLTTLNVMESVSLALWKIGQMVCVWKYIRTTEVFLQAK